MAKYPLSLHHLTALDTSPAELISIAGRLGCPHVTLFTHVPERARGFYPCVEEADVSALEDALAAAGVAVCNIEVFSLVGDEELGQFEQGLRVGAAIGAPRATVHLHEIEDMAAAIRRFSAFAAIAADHGIVAGLEFNAFSAVRDLASAAAIVRGAGRGALVLDVLHLMRNGADVAAIADHADLIGYVQLSDGPLLIDPADAWREAVRERALPGDGAFPLADILRQVAGGAVIEAEIPQSAARKAGVEAFERARRAVDAVRAVLSAVC